jgi:predicted amino acid racemase
MFLNSLLQRNRAFVRAAVELHQAGEIPPNSYVLDLDAMRENARLISDKAHELGLTVFAMSKQFGRNPPALDAVVDGGVDGFVAVDMGCVLPIVHAGHPVGHIGHVVQIPRHEAPRASAANPSFWTVYSLQKAAEAAAAAAEQGNEQRLLARVHAPGDSFYPGQEGGFPVETIDEVLEAIAALDGAAFGGITTFPAIRYDQDSHALQASPNAKTLERAANRLSELGIGHIEINAPGNTSVAALDLLASLGATQVEPGHGLTATTPLHAHHRLPETPAALYLSEVSHEHGGRAYCFGGGLYVDPVFGEYPMQALVGATAEAALERRVEVTLPPLEGIDYYAMLDAESHRPAAGDTVVFGFRIQAFVTRAYVVPLSGVASDSVKVEGIWTTAGTPVDWPEYSDCLSGTVETRRRT